MRNTEINEFLNRLFASFKCGGINLIKLNVPVPAEKCLRLLPAKGVEVGINPAALYDIFKIKIGLAVADQVNFFSDQFCAILAPPSGSSG